VSAIFQRAKWIANVATGRTNAGRNLTVLADDIYLVSYPRSGNTWTRFLIANLLDHENPPSFADIEARIPAINLWPDKVLLQSPRPRILKSHEYFDPRYGQVIYIVRDPRDVAVSMYHYSIKRKEIGDDYPMEHFVRRFIRGEFMSDFANWEDHLRSWTGTRAGRGEFLLLRYEDMQTNLERELAKIAAFLNVSRTPDDLARSARLSSAERLRELERQQSGQWKLTKNTRKDKPFVRSANSGSWKEVLSAESVAEIEHVWGRTMQEFGYELVSEQSAEVIKAGATTTEFARQRH